MNYRDEMRHLPGFKGDKRVHLGDETPHWFLNALSFTAGLWLTLTPLFLLVSLCAIVAFFGGKSPRLKYAAASALCGCLIALSLLLWVVQQNAIFARRHAAERAQRDASTRRINPK